MAYFKFNPDLFLGVPELQKFKKFVDDQGFRKNILQNTVSFGLIKNKYTDPLFTNGRVLRDANTTIGQMTIKVNELFGIDNNGNFLYSPAQTGIIVPTDGNWYWVKVAYATSIVEKGTFTISANGDLVDTSGTAELTKIFRGGNDFPTRISFVNSAFNNIEYDVLEVIDDQHATLMHPASNLDGTASSAFATETGLQIQSVGTFTAGISVPMASKNPFNYDYLSLTLVKEAILNTPPSNIQYQEFYLARVQAAQNTILIHDKRTNYWETKGSELPLQIERKANPAIGIESSQFSSAFAPNDRNLIYLHWGMRSNNWSIDSSSNILTFNSGVGGKYKTVNNFNNGDFDGWRLYFPNGKYSKIVSSVKQGSAINFILDVLDVNNVSADGGNTFITGYCLAVPDCDSVEIAFIPNPADNQAAFRETYTFPVNELTPRCNVLVYNTPSVLYNVQYRYKAHKEYTQWQSIPSDNINGYLTEASFDSNGNLKVTPVTYPYTSDPVNGFIQLQISPLAISTFRQKVDKGDIIGVNDVTALTVSNYPLVVGTAKNYQYISGAITLSNDVYFTLDTVNSKEGNAFTIHFNCSSINLNAHNIYLVYGTGGNLTVLKKIVQGDVWEMMNREGGIVFNFKYDGVEWLMFQNYDLGSPFQIKHIDGTIATQFDNTGMGMVRGLYGHAVMDGRNNTTNLKHLFLVGADPNDPNYSEGKTGGSATHTLAQLELPAVGVTTKDTFLTTADNTVVGDSNYPNIDQAPPDNLGVYRGDTSQGVAQPQNAKLIYRNVTSSNMGSGNSFPTVPPYYAVIICKKLY